MARETVVSSFKLKGREILSSYAAYTLEGAMTARVKRGKDSWTIEERNGIAKEHPTVKMRPFTSPITGPLSPLKKTLSRFCQRKW